MAWAAKPLRAVLQGGWAGHRATERGAQQEEAGKQGQPWRPPQGACWPCKSCSRDHRRKRPTTCDRLPALPLSLALACLQITDPAAFARTMAEMRAKAEEQRWVGAACCTAPYLRARQPACPCSS